MLTLRPASTDDLEHLRICLSLDTWHAGETYEQWADCKGGLTTFADDAGPIFHMAFEEEEKTLRVHCQFDPRERLRTAKGLRFAFERVTNLARKTGIEKIVFKSESPNLIGFFEKLGFEKEGDDYALQLFISGAGE